MAEHIVHCLDWVRTVLTPHGPGCHWVTPWSHMPRAGRTFIVRAWDPPRLHGARRRPPEQPIAGDATVMVRPYVIADELRRRDLVSAAMGGDAAGPYWIHREEVA
ncbi:hypothetical protein ABZW18_08695 [Streptomyces sp. NPDC004647]|uniref:hypothetical protein n=1 Tax=Streptomyces sp. NPDC004647 TaxID=3154671 RepID=UPI0033BB9078